MRLSELNLSLSFVSNRHEFPTQPSDPESYKCVRRRRPCSVSTKPKPRALVSDSDYYCSAFTAKFYFCSISSKRLILDRWSSVEKMSTMLLLVLSLAASTLAFDGNESNSWKFAKCPEKCECTIRLSEHFQAHMRTVDCSGQDLLDFPVDIPADVQVLLLKDNKLRRIFDGPLYLHDLVHLDLSHNLIRSLGHDSRFRELYNMKVLDISHNRISALRDFVFRGLFNLEDINLSDNPISTIADDCFKGLLKLETLRLSGNRLEYVHPGWWNNVRTLYNLFLDRNYFTFVQSDAFKPLRNLRRLDLGRNKLSRLNEEAFVGLDKLEILIMDYNAFQQIPQEALVHLRASLKSLNFNRNPIYKLRTDDVANFGQLKDISFNNMHRLKFVERGSFKNLPELLVVEMHDNPYLSYVDPLTFVNTPEISHILLHNNNLTTLDRRIVDVSLSLEEISFYGNPLSCDCNVKWLKNFLTSSDNRRRVIFRDAERMVCDSPFEQKFKLFSVLRAADLPDHCAPTIVDVFSSVNARKVGEDVVYDCKSIGVPAPKLMWLDPEGTPITAATYHPRRSLLNDNSLVIRKAQVEDNGYYTCVSENDLGRSVMSVQLNVTAFKMDLAVRRIAADAATLVWSDVDFADHQVFQVLYRESQTVEAQRYEYAGSVASAVKTFALTNLRAGTGYEACLAYKDNTDVVVHINCAQFRTERRLDTAYVSAERSGNVAVGVALGIVASMLILTCLSAVILRARRSRAVDPMSSMENGFYTAASVDNLSRTYSTDNMVAPLVYNKLISISRHPAAAHV